MNSKNSESLICRNKPIDASTAMRFTLRAWITLCSVMSPFINSKAQTTLSMQQVLDSVEQNNPLLASYQYRMNAANTLASGAKSWSPPKAGAGPYSMPYAINGDETFFNRTEGSFLFFVEQDIPNPGKLKAKENYLHSLSAIDSMEAGVMKNKLFTAAKESYIDRFIAEKKMKLIAEQISLLQLMIQSYTNAYENNQGDLAAIYKAKAKQQSLEAMLAHEKSAIAEATTKLNYLMSSNGTSSFNIDTTMRFHDYKLAEIDTSVAFISSRRSDIIKVDQSIRSVQLNNDLNLAARKPDFNLRYEHYDMLGNRNAFSITGAITIPIAPWSAKSYKSQASSSQQLVDAMQLQNRNNINQARAEMQQSLQHTIAEYEEVKRYENNVLPSYQKAFEASMLAYRENTASLLFTLMALDDLKAAQEEYFYHLEQAYKSEISYENSIEKK